MPNTTFSRFWSERLEADKRLTPAVKRHHRVTYRKIHDFAETEALSFEQLTYDLIDRWDNQLHAQNYQANTIYGHHKTLRRYINLAVKLGLMAETANPYNLFKPKDCRKTSRAYLTIHELALIEEAELQGQEAIVRDVFLFGCYTGLRFGDLVRFCPTQLSRAEQGLILRLTAQKTAKDLTLPLDVLFAGKPRAIVERYLQPQQPHKPIFGQALAKHKHGHHFNQVIKQIAQAQGIYKKVTAHVARHTFATTLANKIPIRVLQELLQHSCIETTMIYVHLSQDHITQALNKVAW